MPIGVDKNSSFHITEVHDHMPMILKSEDYDLWLDPGITDPRNVSELPKPLDARLLKKYAVGSRVLRRGAAATLSAAQVEAVQRKVAVWPEIYDEKAPLPGYVRDSNRRNTMRGVTLMSRDELQRLSNLQVAFIGSETRPLDELFRKNTTRLPDNDFVQQHYVDDERESLSDIAVGYHDIDGSELET